jgi:hypothetical protein
MTRLASTCWAGAAFGLAFTSTALAQPPADTTPPYDTTPTTTDSDTDTTTVTVDDDDAMGRTVTPPADIDVNVTTPPPPPPQPRTDYVIAPTTYVNVNDDDDKYRPRSGLGIAIAAGGGVGAFTHDAARLSTNPGGDWDVRLTLGTRSPIAFEGSYIGSAQSIDALGLDSGAVLVGNGLQGALRVNTTIDFPVQPFFFGGLGWRHYEIMNTNANLSDFESDDDVLEIPLGVGIAGKYRGLILDARGEFRATAYESMIPEAGEDDDIELDQDSSAAMHRWGVKATVGFEF